MAMQQQQSSSQHMMTGGHPKTAMYTSPSGAYSNHQVVYPMAQYGDTTSAQQHLQYGSVPPPVGVLDQSYGSAGVFSTPPLSEIPAPHSESSPESYHTDHYNQHDLADLLGPLKLDERGTGEFGSPSKEPSRKR